MEIDRFLSPYPCYSDPRAAPTFGVANPWQNYSGNAAYQTNNPYSYGNTEHGACYNWYQQQFNQKYPLYSSNFSPHDAWQGASVPSTPYLYQPSGFTSGFSSNSWSAGVVPQGATTMGFFSNNNVSFPSDPSMVGNNYRSEQFYTALPFQQQYPLSSTAIADSYPIGYSIDEEIPMVINDSTFLDADEILNNVFIADNLIESASSKASLEGAGLAESELWKEENHSSLEPQPELKESFRYDNELDLHVESMSSGSSSTFSCCHQSFIDKEIDGYYLRRRQSVNGLAEDGDDKEESKMFMGSLPLAMYTKLDILEDEHKVFDEMLTSEGVGYFDKLDVVCGDFVEIEKHWGDNTSSVVEEVNDVLSCIESGNSVTSLMGEAQAQRYSGGGAHLVINSSWKNHYEIGQLENMRMEDAKPKSMGSGVLEVSQEEDSCEEVDPLKGEACPALKMLLGLVMNPPTNDGFELENQNVDNTYSFNIDVNKSEHSPFSIIIPPTQNYLATNGVTDDASNAVTKSSTVHSLVELVRKEWLLLHSSLINFAFGDILGREVDSSLLGLLGRGDCNVDFVDSLNDLRELRPLDFTFFSCIRMGSQVNAQSKKTSLKNDSYVVHTAITMCFELNATYLVFENLIEKGMQLVLIVSNGNSTTSASSGATSDCDRSGIKIVMIRIFARAVEYAAMSNIVVIAEVIMFHSVSDSMKGHLPLVQGFPGGGTYEALVTYWISVSLYLVFAYMKHDLAGLAVALGINNESSLLSKTIRLRNCNYRFLITRTLVQHNLHELMKNFIRIVLVLSGKKEILLSHGMVIVLGTSCSKLMRNPENFVINCLKPYSVSSSHCYNCVKADKFGILLWLIISKDAAMSRIAMIYPSLLTQQQFPCRSVTSFLLNVPSFLLPTLLFQACQIKEKEIMIKKAFMKDMEEEKNLDSDGKYANPVQCKELKIGSCSIVAAAYANNSHFITSSYKPTSGEFKKKFALFGKKLTFASGGFIIRTGPGCLIEPLKFDMGRLSWFPFDRGRMKFLTLEDKGVVNGEVLI